MLTTGGGRVSPVPAYGSCQGGQHDDIREGT